MSTHQLDERGAVRDWLVAGPWAAPLDLDGVLDATGSPWGQDGRWVLTNGPDVTPFKASLYHREPLADQPPPAVVSGGEARWGEHQDTWRRVCTAADGLVDLSEFCFTPEKRVALAGTAVEVDQAEWRTITVASTGPVLLYVGGACVLRTDQVTYMEPAGHDVRVWLPSGVTEIVVVSWQAGFRECRQILRLRIGGLPCRVVIPGEDGDEHVDRLLNAFGTPRWGITEPAVELTGPDVEVRVQCGPVDRLVRLVDGRADVPLVVESADQADAASMLSTGERTVRVSIGDQFREFPVCLLPPYRGEPVGTREQWRREVLEHAAAATGCAAELAAVALHPAHAFRPDRVARSRWMIEHRADCADFEAVGLLHLWHRLPVSRELVRELLLGFKYWIDQPGLDAMCYFTENHQFVWHTAELLAGQLFADETFANTGWTGSKHQEHGREMAVQWLERKLATGYSEFDSNAYLAVDVLALTTLVEFCADEEVVELSVALLDKTLFTLAANSWRGIHGCAHGRSYVHTQRSARLEETAPIAWLCWGVGALNTAVLPATVLATAVRYVLPESVRTAAELPREWLGTQSYRGHYRPRHDLLSRSYESDLVVFKTPDFSLSSVQDYRAGLPGLQEHVWGAVLGPETQVYATHPANDATHSSARPNAWAGHRILPRVRQHRDVVLAVHRIPSDDPAGRTHAWFPMSTMDEWRAVGGWLAGRRGNGFVAITTDGGCRVVTVGPNAYQEVLGGKAWVCTVGSGSFDEFCTALGEPSFAADGVDYRGLSLRWDQPFTVDGRPVPLGDLHLDNPLAQVGFGDALALR